MKKTKPKLIVRNATLWFSLILFLVHLPMLSFAECSDSKIKRLSRQGKTISNIAKTCEIEPQEVREILEEANGDDDRPAPDSRQGFPYGTPLNQCGCWGYVSPGYRMQNSACASGYAAPSVCPAPCYGGGYAWQVVCL